jgi:ectoine hydroxylase-related dioxygenase (phytanoyl-CoA dioxygenase family)
VIESEAVAGFSRDELIEEGVTGPVRVLSVLDAGRACEALFLELARQRASGGGVELAGWHRHVPWAYEIAAMPMLVSCMDEACGGPCAVWASELWVKPPASEMEVPWHQDHVFWPSPNPRTFSAWVALTEASTANGGAAFVRGSHGRVWSHGEVDTRKGGLDRGIAGGEVPEAQVWRPRLSPGEAVIFDGRTVHGSPPNRSARPRVGYTVRYVLDETGARGASARPAVILGWTERALR